MTCIVVNCKLPWPISVGVRFVEGKGGDRFTASYKEGIPILDRIRMVGTMRGVKGIARSITRMRSMKITSTMLGNAPRIIV